MNGADLTNGLGAARIKACCATGYSSDLVSMLLGTSYHPGGTQLTRRLLDAVDLQPGERLADVASGVGTTALLAVQEYNAIVDGIDLSASNVARATAAVEAAGIDERARFQHGDAEALPLGDAGWDVIVCECALCTFPDKPIAVAEMARVLRPGGRVGISDVTADRDRLPAELTGLGAWIGCVADARPAEEYEALLTAHGLRVRLVEPHREALDRMVLQIAARIELLRMMQRDRAAALGLDFDRIRPILSATQHAVENGALGYALIVAEKPCA
ncbi:class I SAM-dependent methyltransferase [Cumulibacter manganitolerans]|uniref:class I SAM-dependent methyltransferase n=1 Tax=Cumulibacter manganitolerans TaxID=1884992 RepID=UPI0012975E4C|nr:methyltransferase domain-containing protein [Cumulibacter manganitolerans]